MDVTNAQAIFLSNYFLQAVRQPGVCRRSTGCRQRSTTSGSTALSPTLSRRSRWPSWATVPRSCPCRSPASRPPASSPRWRPSAAARGSACCRISWWRASPEFVPVLPDDFQRQLPIWAVARPESLRSAPVRAVLEAIRERNSGAPGGAGGLRRACASRLPACGADPCWHNGNSPGPAVRDPGCCCDLILVTAWVTSCRRRGGPRCPGRRRRRRRGARCRGFP